MIQTVFVRGEGPRFGGWVGGVGGGDLGGNPNAQCASKPCKNVNIKHLKKKHARHASQLHVSSPQLITDVSFPRYRSYSKNWLLGTKYCDLYLYL